jgi:hypothetical protein
MASYFEDIALSSRQINSRKKHGIFRHTIRLAAGVLASRFHACRGLENN